jgi:S-adenosylmethionine:tRNA ribosyltransferase-isomerase
MTTFTLSDFDFQLPPELIAQSPATERAGSRLLEVSPDGALTNHRFTDLLHLLSPGDLLVFNNSKVIRARLAALKPTGGQVELLVERITSSTTATALMRVSRKPAAGSGLRLSDGSTLWVEGRDPIHEDRFLLRFESPVLEVLERLGELPLPPYIEHAPTSEDDQRYQTVYAKTPGSVAAPTAGLHFDEPLLAALEARGVELASVTLHVGSGTFAPVKHEDLSQHVMHSEWCVLPEETAEKIVAAKARGGKVVAVGTTSLRTLESLHGQAGARDTNLFITPGYSFNTVDRLVTNFHLPKSTLMMLVSAFAGYDLIRKAYSHAIEHRYRFFSYGDAMILTVK